MFQTYACLLMFLALNILTQTLNIKEFACLWFSRKSGFGHPPEFVLLMLLRKQFVISDRHLSCQQLLRSFIVVDLSSDCILYPAGQYKQHQTTPGDIKFLLTVQQTTSTFLGENETAFKLSNSYDRCCYICLVV